MRRFGPIFALFAASFLPRSADAVQAPPRASVPLTFHDPAAASGVLVAAPGTPALRNEVGVRYGAAPGPLAAAWKTFVADTGDTRWNALWDTATRRPLRIFGGSIPAPGTSKDAAAAEKHARDFLTRHATLLLAGRSLADLDLVTNDDDAGLRTIGFQQMTYAGGARVPVLGGRVNLRYKADRLFVLGGEALAVEPFPAPQVELQAARAAALAHLAPVQPSASVTSSALVALPLVARRGHRVVLAWRVSTQSTSPESRTDVYVDARDGSVIATQEGLRFLTGTLKYDAPVRGPQDHQLFPASRAHVVIDDKQYSSSTDGEFSFDETAAAFACFARSTQVNVVNESGEQATLPFGPPADGDEVTWSLSDDELGDAQLSAFIHTAIAKDEARKIDPALGFLNAKLNVRVNQDDQDYACNAYFNGVDLNFFQQYLPCNNTARLADVVYHEFGHAFHYHTMLPSVGTYDSALGEGGADYYASIITGDPILSPGFFVHGGYLREFDTDRRWPDDIDWDPHETGLIFAGAAWDLRTILTEELGEVDGPELAHALYRGALRRAPNIPSTFVEVLATDDDDGDLGNGTPHICQIMQAYAPHGLTPYLTDTGLQMFHEPWRLLPAQETPYQVKVDLGHAFPQCAKGDDIDEIEVRWSTPQAKGSAALTKDGDTWVGEIPGQPKGTQIRYSVRATAGQYEARLPNNPADQEYKVFTGDVTPLYCTDFEAGAADWSFGEEDGKVTDFEWGKPEAGGDDPATAFSGENVIGTNLNTQGDYRKNRSSFAKGPVVSLGGHEHARLQLMRWLHVEDGYFDQATIRVNGQVVWVNQGTEEWDGSLTHTDYEWRFEDIDISGFAQGSLDQVQISFELYSDDGTEYGGWNIDDVCVVAWEPPPPAIGAGGAGGAGGGDEGGGGAGAGNSADDIHASCACRSSAPVSGDTPWALLGLATVLGLGARRRKR